MAKEYNTLIENGTWDLVPYHKGMNLVGSIWIYKTKLNSNGSVECDKARLVAQGIHQRPDSDYFKTFSLVVRPTTVRLVLSLAISFGWAIRQLDVKNAFLHGDLTEEVYMKQPPGFVHLDFPDYACKLKKAIYGLKQAPCAWFYKFSSFLLSSGFTCSLSDTSMFVYKSGGNIIILLLYIDDIILTSNFVSLFTTFIDLLSRKFPMKDLGDLHYFLGV